MVGAFDPAAVFQTFAECEVTVTNLVPTMLNDLVNHEDSQGVRLPAFRLVMSGGAPISPPLVRRVIDTFRCEYVQTYGLTETSPYLTFSLLKEHLRRLPPEDQIRYRSMTGRPAHGVQLRLVDEEGNDVPADGRSVGEIVARGDRITPGYWRLPDATAEAFRDGWFHTGDLATVEGEGYFNIVDRKKDVILTGGELVYSTEVENALYDHPAVFEAAVEANRDTRDNHEDRKAKAECGQRKVAYLTEEPRIDNGLRHHHRDSEQYRHGHIDEVSSDGPLAEFGFARFHQCSTGLDGYRLIQQPGSHNVTKGSTGFVRVEWIAGNEAEYSGFGVEQQAALARIENIDSDNLVRMLQPTAGFEY